MAKNNLWSGLPVMVLVFIVLGGCVTTGPATVGTQRGIDSLNVIPGPNESVIIVQRAKSVLGVAVPMQVWINDQPARRSIMVGQEVQVIVDNGTHTVQAGTTAIDRGNTVTLSVNQEATFFIAEPKMGLLAARFNLTQTGKINTSGAVAQYAPRVSIENVQGVVASNLDQAVSNVSGVLADKIPQKFTIAVANVSSTDTKTSEYIIGELEFHFVSSGKFRIVDRKRLDQIMREQKFQMSGNVSDDSAVSIGNMLGADVIIIGEVTENSPNKRLSAKAIDVTTGEILSMGRADF
jgi:hypothetical protein